MPARVAVFALSGALSCASWAGVSRADEAPTRPEKRESDGLPPPSVRLPTAIGGLAFTAGVWGLGAGVSYLTPDSAGVSQLRVPVAGPFAAMRDNACPESGCDVGYYARHVLFALSGLAQVGGLGVALESLLVPTGAPGAASPSSPSSPSMSSPRAPAAPPSTKPASEPSSPPPSTQPSGPSSPGGGGRPMFYLPVPTAMGREGVGLVLGGVFLGAGRAAKAERLALGSSRRRAARRDDATTRRRDDARQRERVRCAAR